MINPTLEFPINFTAGPGGTNLGLSREGITRINTAFEQQIRDGLHPGAQLVVLRNGQVIVDRSGGIAEKRPKRPITPETRFLTFSLTKPFTSACIFKLIEDGKIKLDEPVGRYWPEFASQGKEQITIRHVLTHQSGLSRTSLVYQILVINNWQRITTNLSRQKPEFPPGSKTAYQLLNYGYILGEVFYRVMGITIDEYLQCEFLSHMGLKNTSMKARNFQKNKFAKLYSKTLDHQLIAWIFNSKRVRTSLIPAASLQSTARDIAVFFQMLLNQGKYAGRHYLSPQTVQLMSSLGNEDYDQSLGRIIRWGYGFFLGGEHKLQPNLTDGMGKGSSQETFGHFGQRNSMVWADKRTGLLVVFLCNGFLASDENKTRLQQISNAVWDAIE